VSKKKKNKKYKLKTHKATAKRFRTTGSGKVVRTKGPKSHLRRNKSKRTRRMLSGTVEVKNAAEKRRIKRLAPYMKKYKANPPA
jgi:large subunit ribosomal protein L35